MLLLALEELVKPLTQFGVAGLMGLLWVWERRLSRRRETQLDEAHRRLTRRASELRLLVKTINRNTRVIERFERTQRGVLQLLERMGHDAKTGGDVERDARRRGRGAGADDAGLHEPAGGDAAAARDRGRAGERSSAA
ncbi:MAG: hypothetical protein GVY24_03325 [Planctomycetes bacterium]|jgi:hypothetical protein|nr:hypothetical protein [Planctomycetota bacterium]